MPLYDVKCDECGKVEEIVRSIAEMDNLPKCCGKTMHRLVCAPRVMSDISPYRSQVTGEMITSRSHHRSHLKQHGLIEVGDQKPVNNGPSESEKKKDAYELRRTIAQVMDSKGV